MPVTRSVCPIGRIAAVNDSAAITGRCVMRRGRVRRTVSLRALADRAMAATDSVRARDRADSLREIGPAAPADTVAAGSSPADPAESADDSRL